MPKPPQTRESILSGPHEFKDGTYVPLRNFKTSEYPKMKYHPNGSSRTVKTPADESALTPDWFDSPKDAQEAALASTQLKPQTRNSPPSAPVQNNSDFAPNSTSAQDTQNQGHNPGQQNRQNPNQGKR